MISYFNEQGRYLWVGNETIHFPGMPTPPTHPHANAFGVFKGRVDQFKQYHDIVSDTPVDMPTAPSSSHVFDYVSKSWFDPRTAESEWELVRIKRNELLAACDWVVAKATELGEPVPANWQKYRTALRDVTMQSDPFAIDWPVI